MFDKSIVLILLGLPREDDNFLGCSKEKMKRQHQAIDMSVMDPSILINL